MTGHTGSHGGIPFRLCRARPDGADGRPAPLAAHLAAVGQEAEALAPSGQGTFLRWAGYLHDLGKARASWQRRLKAGSGPRVPHAFLGAYVFFALFAGISLPAAQRRLVLWLTRDLACHHGRLDDVTEEQVPWEGGWEASAWKELDWAGIVTFLQQAFPDGPALPDSAATLAARETALRRTWRNWVMTLPSPPDPLRESLPWSAARLVAADRFHAGEVSPMPGMTPEQAAGALSRLRRYLAERAATMTAQGAGAMAERRSRLQETVREGWRQADGPLYLLQAPTGSGKTLLALELALERIARSSEPRRLIYLAPFINLVTDVAQVVRDATGQEVLEHHHLALPDDPSEPVKGGAPAVRPRVETPDGALLVMDAWQAPVVVSTFNQFFRALLPARAQQAMRMVALEKALVVVDEPQTLAAPVWAPLVQGLELLAAQAGAEILLMSATLPPFPGVRLSRPPAVLAEPPPPEAWPARYRLTAQEGAWSVETVAREAVAAARREGATAVILNTVADAVTVYEAISADPGVQAVNLHGAMHPLHKAHQIRRVREMLGDGTGQPERPLVVVSTQVMEAGVDLNFRSLFRARAVLSSMVQAAGRANRHGQAGNPADVRVFDFVREDGSDSRVWVYRNRVYREETDRWLPPGNAWTEIELVTRLASYYRSVFDRSPQTALLDRFRKAASGQWSELAGLEPFEQVPYHRPVFVPVAGPEQDPLQWLDEPTQGLIDYFAIPSLEAIYDRLYDRGFLGGLGPVDRRRFLNLMGKFTVSMPVKTLQILTEWNPEREVQRLVDVRAYSPTTGLGRWVRKEDQGEAIFL
ncbi:MAG: CRISPR-associated helicase Cas3' [Firmicutes bacterium]|nr:CRISPR-associated helicase Cas3' [Bacillota bacterium]